MQLSDLNLDIDSVQMILSRYGVTDVAVFGSFSRGDAKVTSDLDLLVTYAPGTTLFDVCRLQNELEVVLRRKVDLVSLKSIRKRLSTRIEEQLIHLDTTQ